MLPGSGARHGVRPTANGIRARRADRRRCGAVAAARAADGCRHPRRAEPTARSPPPRLTTEAATRQHVAFVCSSRENSMLFGRAAILAALSVGAASTSQALAHCYVGARFFPAMLATDDPCVADELSLPTISAFKPEGTRPLQ